MESVALQDRASAPEFGPLLGTYHFDPDATVEATLDSELEVEIEIVSDPSTEYAIAYALAHPVERARETPARELVVDDAELADTWFVAPDEACDVAEPDATARPIPVLAILAFGIVAALATVPVLGL